MQLKYVILIAGFNIVTCNAIPLQNRVKFEPISDESKQLSKFITSKVGKVIEKAMTEMDRHFQDALAINELLSSEISELQEGELRTLKDIYAEYTDIDSMFNVGYEADDDGDAVDDQAVNEQDDGEDDVDWEVFGFGNAEDEQADDEKADNEEADDEEADAEEADDEKADDKEADVKEVDDEEADDEADEEVGAEGADDEEADYEEAGDEEADVEEADNKEAGGEQADDSADDRVSFRLRSSPLYRKEVNREEKYSEIGQDDIKEGKRCTCDKVPGDHTINEHEDITI